MKKSRKILGLTMSVLLMLALFAGCGNKPAAEDTPDSGAPASEPVSAAPASDGASQAPASDGASQAPAEEMTSLEKLLSMEDKLPLGGLQPAHLESRADIDKALP
jgi:hypothetical protein